jgi:hypothetical protein
MLITRLVKVVSYIVDYFYPQQKAAEQVTGLKYHPIR